MRITIPLGLLLVLLLPAVLFAQTTQTSLNGMTPGDNLSKILSTAGAPDSIQAIRGSTEAADYAVLLWETRQVGVILTPGGDKTFGIITASPSVTTNDGLAVGNSRDKITQSRGMPDEVDSIENMNTMWYWKQGAAFLLDKQNNVAMIFAFTPGSKTSVPKLMSLPSDQIKVSHACQSVGQEYCVFGTVKNAGKQTIHDVHLGIKLLDSDGKVVNVINVLLGDVSPNSTVPFNAIVPAKGSWSTYQVDSLALDKSATTSVLQIEKVKWLLGELSKVAGPTLMHHQ